MEEEIPKDDDAKNYTIKEFLYHSPLWMTVADYETIVHARKIIKLYKYNKIVKNKDDIMLIFRYIDAVKTALFSSYNLDPLCIELSPYNCTISGVNEFIMAPSHPELLIINSATYFKNKKIKVDSQLGEFLDGLIPEITFSINLSEHGMIKRIHKGIIVMRHSHPEINDMLLYFPKWVCAG